MTAMDVVKQLGITLPVLAAPMAGGPTSPAMAIAAGYRHATAEPTADILQRLASDL